MTIRALQPNDVEEIRKLHEQYFGHLEFPNLRTCMNAFIIESDKEVILAGFVEKVAEVMLVTNKNVSNISIGRALVEAQRCSAFTCANLGIQDMYAFVESDTYAKHLIQHGFIEANRALKLRIK